MTMRLSGFADSFSTAPLAVAPAGAPFGNADFTLPLMRAASVYFWPDDLKPSRSCDGSNSIAKRCDGMSPAWSLDVISGSKHGFAALESQGLSAVAPCTSLPTARCPMLATFTELSPASTTSFGLKLD